MFYIIFQVMNSYLKQYLPSYYFSFIYGLIPFQLKNGLFEISPLGIILWIAQLCLVLLYFGTSLDEIKKTPCKNALSCALFIQSIITSSTIVIRILLIIIKHKSIKTTLNNIFPLIQNTKCNIEMKDKRRIILISKFTMKLIVVLRCIFIYVMKNSTIKTVLPYICTISEIQLEIFISNLLYVTSSCLRAINTALLQETNQTKTKLIELQKLHNLICDYSKYIQNAFSAIIAVSVFSILSQLLLIAYFEVTLNIKPIPRNWKMELYLTVNIVYILLNIGRVALVCCSSQSIEDEYNKTHEKLQLLSDNNYDLEEQIECFSIQLNLRNARFSGCGLFNIDRTLLTEIISIMSIYTTTMVGFTTFNSDTSAVYGTYVSKNT